MAEINRLSLEISNLISAGEVVERPASVVKELVENSIDADAKRIEVEIRNGGISYIRVTDDGKGIYPEDVRTAFLRHATSKIKCENDLFSIGTLGFRGEALAAIAAVSKIDIFSKHAAINMGTHLVLEGGKEISFTEHGCPKGTTIVVQDLFFNTPARMKFLKNDKTESGHIAGIIEHLAVSRPDIAIKLVKDGREAFSTIGDGDLKKAIYSVYGNEFSDGLINVYGKNQGIEIYGAISPVNLSRANKNMQNFFINGRYIRSKLLYAALERAYQGRLVSGRMPICFLNLTVPYMNVDVNVHPTKLEVKFSNEKRIFDVVYGVITDSLNTAAQFETGSESVFISSMPTKIVDTDDLSTYPKESFEDGVVNKNQSNIAEFYRKIIQSKAERLEKEAEARRFAETEQSRIEEDIYTQPEPPMQQYTVVADKNPVEYIYQPTNEYKAKYKLNQDIVCLNEKESKDNKRTLAQDALIIGEVFKTYIIVEHEGKLKIIDKHAVHEKMVYNKIIAEQPENFGQSLLEPLNVSLTREEKALVLEKIDIFERLGFEIDDMGANMIAVRKAPYYIGIDNVKFVITDMAEKISEYKFQNGDLIDDIVKNVACKAAVKAGFINVNDELKILVDAVLTDSSLASCPHGRPSVYEMTRYQIEKLFKRS